MPLRHMGRLAVVWLVTWLAKGPWVASWTSCLLPRWRPPYRLALRSTESSDNNCETSLRVVLEEAGASRREASRAAAALSPSSYGSATLVAKWLVDYGGFTGSDAAQMLSSCPPLSQATNATGDMAQTVSFMFEVLGMKKGEVRRVARAQPRLLLGDVEAADEPPVIFDTGACPAVLATSSGGPLAPPSRPPGSIRDTVDLLRYVGLREKRIKEMVVRWPQLLDIELPQLLAVTDYLAVIPGFWVGCSDDLDVPRRPRARRGGLGALYRQAPWLLTASVGDQLRPSVEFLRTQGGVADLEKVVRAYPRCLITPPAEMRVVLDALVRYGVDEADLGRLVESFPLVFGLSPADTMDPAVAYWRQLGVKDDDVARICRAFPSLLGVRVDCMKQSVAFLQEIGVTNLGRFVTRLPPVLAYDVDTVLRPKMQFAVRHALSVYDVARFPAFFSYPLDAIIQPRAEFLAAQSKHTLAGLGLNVVLPPKDADFAKLAGSSPQAYAAFKQTYLQPNDAANPTSSKSTKVQQLSSSPSITSSPGKRRPRQNDAADATVRRPFPKTSFRQPEGDNFPPPFPRVR